jgi:hypothetical protein
MMTSNFTPEFVLDMLQGYKANLIQTYVSDLRIRNPILELISAETTFMRQVIKTSTGIFTAVFDDVLTETNKTIKKIY